MLSRLLGLIRRRHYRPEVVIIPPGWRTDRRLVPKPVAAAHRRYRYGRLTRRESRKPKGGA